MSQSERSATDSGTEPQQSPERTREEEAGAWFAASTFRVALALLGLVLLLFALGRAVGVDLLGLVVEGLQTQIGRWLAVAVFALAIIAIALRGFRGRRT